MSHNYGLISSTDAATLEKTIDLILKDFLTIDIAVTEIGLFDCMSARGIREYILSKDRRVIYTGIDNNADKKINPPEWMNFIEGNSCEVYNQLEDFSQNLIFVDGNHSFPCVVQDFFCYAPKVRVDGYICFHDTGKHIKQFKDYQRMGSKADPDMYIAVRKALEKIGLFENVLSTTTEKFEPKTGWELIFDEADESDPAGGVAVFKKLF